MYFGDGHTHERLIVVDIRIEQLFQEQLVNRKHHAVANVFLFTVTGRQKCIYFTIAYSLQTTLLRSNSKPITA